MSLEPRPPEAASAAARRVSGWEPIVVAVLVLGYLSMTRSFAYLGVASARLYVGEAALALFVLLRPRWVLGRWAGALEDRTRLSGLAWLILLSIAHGVVEAARGIASERPVLAIAKNVAFHYYPLFLFVGVSLAARDPGFLRRLLSALAWWNGLYGTAYVLVLSRLDLIVPGSPNVPVFGQPIGASVALLGLLAFERDPRRIVVPAVLNAFVLLGIQSRAEWLGFAAGLLVVGVLSRQTRRVIAGASAVALLLVIGHVTDLRLPSPRGRGGELAVRELVARAIAPLDPEAAERYSPDAAVYAGTATWRTTWWRAIWRSVSVDGDLSVLFLGHGYGFALASLVNYGDEELRTPHNIFFYLLGYKGWVGVVLFGLLQLSLARRLLEAHRRTGQSFGLALWAMALTEAQFSNFYETPYGAIPFFVLTGLAMTAAPVPVPSRRAAVLRAEPALS